jgi:hypothetical protein
VSPPSRRANSPRLDPDATAISEQPIAHSDQHRGDRDLGNETRRDPYFAARDSPIAGGPLAPLCAGPPAGNDRASQ